MRTPTDKRGALDAMPYVSDFIRRLQADLRTVSPLDIAKFAWWTSRDGGTLFLTQEELVRYGKVIDRLSEDFVRRGDMSRRSVERLLLDAVFGALDLSAKTEAKTEGSFEERLQRAVGDLRAALSTKPIPYDFFVPVDGFSPADLPLTFGGIKFAVFGEAQRRRLRKDTKVRDVAVRLKGLPCAAVRVEARDFAVAQERAMRTVHDAMDCLNFVASTLPYNYSWLRLPGEATPTRLTTAGGVPSKGFTESHVATGPLGPFRLDELRASRPAVALTSALSKLFKARRPKRQTVGEVLLAAIGSAGRAAWARERELGFLLFAISLETVVLQAKDEGLSYRLGLRVARFLSRTPARRAWMRQRVVQLYGERSKIVHSGSYEMTEADVRLLRSITTSVLLRLLKRRKLWAQNASALEELFRGIETGR